jgi:hypothetical protein
MKVKKIYAIFILFYSDSSFPYGEVVPTNHTHTNVIINANPISLPINHDIKNTTGTLRNNNTIIIY